MLDSIEAAREPTIRTEKVEAGGFAKHKGWLELTSRRLVFRRKEGAAPEFEVDLSAVVGVRAKKAFRAGVEVLEITYSDSAGKRQTKAFERMSWAQWANDVNAGTGRAEANSFGSFERDIADARARLMNPTPAAQPQTIGGDDRLETLKRLGELRASGVLTEAEFETEKARILAS